MKVVPALLFSLLPLIALAPVSAQADNDDLKTDAAVGGGLGGAIGGAIGSEVGGRDGAIIGAGIGAAAGAAIGTSDQRGSSRNEGEHWDHESYEEDSGSRHGDHPKGQFCPPGQAKKGRC